MVIFHCYVAVHQRVSKNTTPKPHPQRRQFLQLPFWLTKMRSREDGQTSIHVLPFKALPLSLLQARSNFLCYELTKIGTHQLITTHLHMWIARRHGRNSSGEHVMNVSPHSDPPTSGFISWDLIIQHNPLSSQKPRSWRRRRLPNMKIYPLVEHCYGKWAIHK